MLDKNGTCKVGDFGLSQIMKNRQRMRDEGGRIGSPYWMAPEVLLRGEIDSKVDVYAFGLLFWEILTRKPLFPGYHDLDQFIKCIAKENVRPSVDDIDPILRRILERSWSQSPHNRPSFEELVHQLENSLIEIYFEVCVCEPNQRQHHIPPPTQQLAYPTGAWFWQQYFHGCTRIRWTAFLEKLHGLFPRQQEVEAELLPILCERQENEDLVSIEGFRRLLLWFGDLQVNRTSSILDRFGEVLRMPWFFGSETAMGAEKLLRGPAKSGVFLVRLNMGGSLPANKSPFTISFVDGDKISHTRVVFANQRTQLKFTDKAGNTVTFPNQGIVNFVKTIMEQYPQVFSTPCPKVEGDLLYVFNEEVKKT